MLTYGKGNAPPGAAVDERIAERKGKNLLSQPIWLGDVWPVHTVAGYVESQGA